MANVLQLMSKSILGILPAVALVVISLPGQAAILAPGSTAYGKTLGEWSAEWWKYIFSLPIDQNPQFDNKGEKEGNGQSGPVFFLAKGPTGQSNFVERTITVSADKAIFFPILNAESDNIGRESPLTVEELRDEIAQIEVFATDMYLNIDGVEIPKAELFTHREVSPVFGFTLPENNILDFPAGFYEPAVSDGYWFMLEPLAAGQHTLTFGGTFTFPDNSTATGNYKYNINVAPVPEPTVTLGLLALGTLGASSALKRRQKPQKF